MSEELEALKKEYEEILNQLSDPELISDTRTPVKRGEERSSSSWPKGDESKDSSSSFTLEELLERKKFLEKIIDKEKEIEKIKDEIDENKGILKSQEDQELSSLAETEIAQLKEKQIILEKEIKSLLSSPDKDEKKEIASVIVEIRAGTGGQEAALFAADLFRMYSKYAVLESWQQKTLDSRPSDLGGFKEIVFELKNGDVFSKMKYEGGVHRVQRIPETEKSGRTHTSTASVAILAKPKKAKLKIRPDELRVDFYRSSGPGGQYVNRRETAVRITHLPTGLVAASQAERNQLRNRENAMSILEVKILERRDEEDAAKLGNKRNTQIGRAKRSEKIRTYNFPQDRVTDHRIKKSFHNIEGIIDGKLEPIIEALKKQEEKEI